MADFPFNSNTDKSAVEQILAEAMDHCVLEQVAAINCSSFSNSVLPSNLESRFQRLKTFPSSSNNPIKPQAIAKNSDNNQFKKKSVSDNSIKTPEKELKKTSISDDFIKTPEKETDFDGKSQSGSSNSSSGYLNPHNFRVKNGGKDGNFSSGCLDSPKVRGKKGDKRGKDVSFSSGSNSFGSNSSENSTKTVKTGCFWCSPKRVSKKKSGGRNGEVKMGDDWGKHDELLSDLRSFSEKKQRKLMKIAKKEEEKISKEAEEIVKWAKQTSARLDFSVIHDDDLSDDDI